MITSIQFGTGHAANQRNIQERARIQPCYRGHVPLGGAGALGLRLCSVRGPPAGVIARSCGSIQHPSKWCPDLSHREGRWCSGSGNLIDAETVLGWPPSQHRFDRDRGRAPIRRHRKSRQERDFWDQRPGVETALLQRTETMSASGGPVEVAFRLGRAVLTKVKDQLRQELNLRSNRTD
jgi:hypothetical protein